MTTQWIKLLRTIFIEDFPGNISTKFVKILPGCLGGVELNNSKYGGPIWNTDDGKR